MQTTIHAIIYQDLFDNRQYLSDTMHSLAVNGIRLKVTALGDFAAPSQLAQEIDAYQYSGSIASIQFAPLKGEPWYSAINAYVGNTDYLLFIANGVILEPNCLNALIDALSCGNCSGVNPVLLQRAQARVSHLGFVADSQMRLHSLYEGMARANPLLQKTRFFQLAHPAVFLVRGKDFHAIGGFRPETLQLCFFDFCARLREQTGSLFRCVPAAVAIYENFLAALATTGLWNSLILRGKLAPGTLIADFQAYARADGLEYGVTSWLTETCENASIWDENVPWLNWRHDPSPASLLRWLASLSPDILAQTLHLIREFPANLPAQFQYYISLSMRLQEYAKKENLEVMAGQLARWQRSARSFHYGQLRKGMEALENAGIYNASLHDCPGSYDAWLELAPNAQTARITPGESYPEIAVVMPVYNPEPDFLRQAIDSVKTQAYPKWQLCIADDASPNPEIRSLLTSYSIEDPRIKIAFRPRNGHICEATNSAIELVDAPWAAFMDHDDLLAPDALVEVAKAAFENPGVKLIYSDEDKIDNFGVRRSPCFDSTSVRVDAHLTVYDTEILFSCKGVRSGYEGAQDHDLYLRAIEKIRAEEIYHISRILYHWRIHEGSTAGSVQSKPYVIAAAKKAADDFASRQGGGRSIPTPIKLIFKIQLDFPANLSAAIVVLELGAKHGPALNRVLHKLRDEYSVAIHFQKVAQDAGSDGWIEAYKEAASQVQAEILLFVSDALEPLRDCRPEQLIIACTQNHVAMAGSLLWRNSLLWNGGFYPGLDGLPFPLLMNIPSYEVGLRDWCAFLQTRRVLALPWQCVAVRREYLLEGFDHAMGFYALADFCLRQQEQGRAVIASPWGQWQISGEMPPQAPTEMETQYFLERWGETVAKSGLRNANLKAAPDNDWGIILPD